MRGSSRDESLQRLPVRPGQPPDHHLGRWRRRHDRRRRQPHPGELDLDIDGGPGRDLLNLFGYEFYESSLLLDLEGRASYRYHDEEDTSTVPVDRRRRGRRGAGRRGGVAARRLVGQPADGVGGPGRLPGARPTARSPISGGGGDDRLALRSKKLDDSWKNSACTSSSEATPATTYSSARSFPRGCSAAPAATSLAAAPARICASPRPGWCATVTDVTARFI